MSSQLQKYAPLERGVASEPAFRLIRFDPAPNPDPHGNLHCTLTAEPIEGSVYTALSYEWKSTSTSHVKPHTKTHAVFINGFAHDILPNLYHFLRFANDRYADRTLWIDALCIDQSSIWERNHQVQLMAKIYRDAFEVMIWLGRGDADTDAFLDCVDYPADCYLTKVYDELDRPDFHFDFFEDLNHLATERVYNPDSPSWRDFQQTYPRNFAGLMKVVQNTYWNRMWIVQEVILAKHIRVVCGWKDVPLEAITVRLQQAGRLAEEAKVLQRLGAHSMAQLTVRHTIEEIRRLSLAELMYRFEQQECEYLADRMYALLGLRTTKGNLVVDYDRDTAQLGRYILRNVFCKNLLYGPLLLRAIGIPIESAESILGKGFLNQRFYCSTEHVLAPITKLEPQKGFHNPEGVVLRAAKEIPLEACCRPECSADPVCFQPRLGDVVFRLPDLQLRALYRPLREVTGNGRRVSTTSFRFLYCVNKTTPEDSPPIYTYCTISEEICDELRSLEPKVSTWESDGITLSWNLSWRTVLLIWKYTKFEQFLSRPKMSGSKIEMQWIHDTD